MNNYGVVFTDVLQGVCLHYDLLNICSSFCGLLGYPAIDYLHRTRSFFTRYLTSLALLTFSRSHFQKKIYLIPAKTPRLGGGWRPLPSRGVLAELKWGYVWFKFGFFPTYRWRRIFNFINIMSFEHSRRCIFNFMSFEKCSIFTI